MSAALLRVELCGRHSLEFMKVMVEEMKSHSIKLDSLVALSPRLPVRVVIV